jgi:hypothetical protein
MEPVLILSVIFTFIIIISTIDHRYNLRKKKIDAALRMREMEMGLPPGTYSSTKVKSGKKRAELKKGIDDLQQRLANLETIMNNRKAKPEGMQDKEWKE